MVIPSLRGYGPRVFISYSFADTPIAKRLDATLTARGFQVRREDDTSLFNQKLADALPRRIADAEVFIQLLTATANRSEWVARELDYMLEHRQAGTEIIFLPIVFDRGTLSDRLKEWWYLDLPDGQLSDEALAAIERLCLRSVHLLPLAEDDPLTVVEADLEAALAQVPQDGHRVILDSEGKLIGWAQDTLAFAEGVEAEHRESFLNQERGRFDRLVRRQKIHDEVTRRLILEVMREMKTYTNDPIRDAKPPLNTFFQLILSDQIVAAGDVAPPEPHALRTTLKDRVAAARAANTENYSRGYLNPGLYAWVFGEKDGAEALCEMEMGAPGFRSIKVLLPRRVFGDMADIYTRSAITFHPVSELLAGTYINYVVPQIAIHAAYNLVNVSTAREDLEHQYAWQLKQYEIMGLA